MQIPLPSVLGLKKSFGFGDRLGLATPGHVAAVKGTGFAPIFAQQSVREMERTQRTPQEVLGAAQTALAKLGWTQPWGADADHHKTLTRLGLPCETLTKLNEEYLMVAHKLDLAIKTQHIINAMK